MDEDKSKRYESIDALIKAAEVLERNEIISRNKMTLKNNKRLSNLFVNEEYSSYRSNKKINYFKERQLNGQSKEEFSNDLIQTIECIKDLRNDERWYSLIESKLKSDNRALYQELNQLKRQLYKIKNKTTTVKKTKSIDKSYEDEDTSTASEDEDYNKYDSKRITDNMEDDTDDASECEEISKLSQNTKIYKFKHITNSEMKQSKTLSENYSRNKYVPVLINRKRKHQSYVDNCPTTLKIHHSLKNSTMTLSSSIWNHYKIENPKCAKIISVSPYGLIPTSNCEVSSKGHRIA